MLGLLRKLKDWWKGKPGKRSSRWPAVRAAHLKLEPACQVCGRKDKLVEVHHEKPFHLYPELELDPANLLTLCEGPTGCHLLVGHLGLWSAWNPDVRLDAALWRFKVAHRTEGKQTYSSRMAGDWNTPYRPNAGPKPA